MQILSLIVCRGDCHGSDLHADYGEFYIGGETSTWGRKHLHGGGDLVIAVTCLPPPGYICMGETLYCDTCRRR